MKEAEFRSFWKICLGIEKRMISTHNSITALKVNNKWILPPLLSGAGGKIGRSALRVSFKEESMFD